MKGKSKNSAKRLSPKSLREAARAARTTSPARSLFVIIDRGRVVHSTPKRRQAKRILKLWGTPTAFVMRANFEVLPKLLPKVG